MNGNLFKYVMIGSLLLSFSYGCGWPWKKKDIDPNTQIQVLPAAPEDSSLGIVASYIDSVSWLTGNPKLIRLNVFTKEEFDRTPGLKFLGRAYGPDNAGKRGFGIPIYEFYVTKYTPSQSGAFLAWGFKLSWAPCARYMSIVCPAQTNDIREEPVFYSYSFENFNEGIVTLYQYETVGSVASGASEPGTVSYTTDVQELITMQMIYGQNFVYTPVGFIYHSTQEDRDRRLK
ncbi:MAG: hypothetical protein HY390_05095 [Deltaproteobacteria bacterium]|nr:hypothetical protein [Deltaproteobacteria bacterium]